MDKIIQLINETQKHILGIKAKGTNLQVTSSQKSLIEIAIMIQNSRQVSILNLLVKPSRKTFSNLSKLL